MPTKIKVPIQSDLPQRLQGSRILFDPQLHFGNRDGQLTTLALLFGRIAVPEPTPLNLVHWGMDSTRFRSFVEEGIVVPLATGSEPLKDYPDAHQVTRAALIPDAPFFHDYEATVAEDRNDAELLAIVKDLSVQSGAAVTVDSIAFNANWDLVLSLRLNAPVATDMYSRRILGYKCSVAAGGGPLASPSVDDSSHFLAKLLSKQALALPTNLTIDDIRELRKERVANSFRSWFFSELSRARTFERPPGVEVEDHLLRGFRELVEAKAKHIEYRTAPIAAAISVGVGAVLGPLEGIASAAGYPLIRELIRRATDRWGSQRWVDILTDFKKGP